MKAGYDTFCLESAFVRPCRLQPSTGKRHDRIRRNLFLRRCKNLFSLCASGEVKKRKGKKTFILFFFQLLVPVVLPLLLIWQLDLVYVLTKLSIAWKRRKKKREVSLYFSLSRSTHIYSACELHEARWQTANLFPAVPCFLAAPFPDESGDGETDIYIYIYILEEMKAAAGIEGGIGKVYRVHTAVNDKWNKIREKRK
jgi:hypothetical protein